MAPLRILSTLLLSLGAVSAFAPSSNVAAPAKTSRYVWMQHGAIHFVSAFFVSCCLFSHFFWSLRSLIYLSIDLRFLLQPGGGQSQLSQL